MHEYLDGGKCRRVILDREMDGRVDRIACESGEKRCDICSGSARGRRRTRVVVRAGGYDPSQRLERAEEETRSPLGNDGSRRATEDEVELEDASGK